MTSHVSYSELRKNLARYMDEVTDSHAPLHITRQNADSVVMLSSSDFEQIMETLHLVRSPANAAALLTAIREANDGQLSEHDLIDP